MSSVSPEQLRATYREQSKWFASERSRLLRKAGIVNCRRVLDLGTGTGEMLPELRRRTRGEVVGVDNDPAVLALAGDGCIQSDAQPLPFEDASFDLVFTQMFFLWAHPVDQVLSEIRRVLETGAYLIVAAEPDYGGLIEYPCRSEELERFIISLRQEGADPEIGRKLPSLLSCHGFSVEAGTHPSLPVRADNTFRYIPYFWFLARRPSR